MKRMRNPFYAELKSLRARKGELEYDRDDIRPNVVALLKKYKVKGDDLFDDEADKILDSAEKSDDKAAEGLFPDDAHVPLGEKKRVRRDCMALDHILRRKRVLDHAKISHDKAWAAETNWLDEHMDLLAGRPADTTVRAARGIAA